MVIHAEDALPSVRSKGWRAFYKATAIFMLYLILSITFFVGYAQRTEATIQAVVYGEDQVPDYRRANDTTTIQVYSDTNLVALFNPETSASLDLSCNEQPTGGYLCAYSFPQSYQEPSTYTLNIKEDGGETVTKEYIVDGEAPTFTRMDLTQLGPNVKALYTVQDTAFGSVGQCSGLETLSLVVNQNTVATKSLNNTGCADDGSIAADMPGMSGTYPIYLLVTDKLGNTRTSETREIILDTVPPGLPSTFTLLRDGREVTQISTDAQYEMVVDLTFTVQERDLRQVTVDASSFHTDPSLREAYRALTSACVDKNGAFLCTFPGLRLKPANETIAIKIRSQDGKGNLANGTATKVLTIQNTKPTITYLGRVFPRCDDVCFVKSGANDILATLEAPGGMSGGGLFFSFSGQNVVAKNCTSAENSATWECVATISVAGANGAEKELKVLPSSMDVLGNPVIGTLEKQFIIDNQPPINTSAPKMDLACPTSGQELHLSLNVFDNQSTKLGIAANVSKVADREVVTADCTPTAGHNFNCTLTITGFFSTYVKADVPVVVMDGAGNTLNMVIKNFEVCEAIGDVTPNYISHLAVTKTPAVDKRIASLVPFRVMVPLRMNVTGNAQVLQVRRVSCVNDFIVGPSYMMNEFTAAPVLVTHYKYQGAWPTAEVPLNCTLDLTIRRGNFVYVKPEKENLTAMLPLVGQEIGNPGQAIKQKEKQLVSEINDLQDEIDKKAKVDKTLGKICELAEMLGNINAVLQTVKAVLYGVAMAMMSNPYTAKAGMALWEKSLPISQIHNKINTYVWPVGWLPIGVSGPGIVGYIVKWTCAVYECKLYDASTWAQIGMELGTYNNIFGMGNGPQGMELIGPSGEHMQSYSQSFTSADGRLTLYSSGVSYNPSAQEIPGFTSGKISSTDVYEAQLQANNNFVNSIPGDNWIVNPYRSAKYDGLCYPAQLYNARKEKQLKCIELRCIREMAPSGLPITQCEEKYAAQTCLYVESAQARMHSSFADILKNAVAAIAMQMALGWAVQWGYKTMCPALYSMTDLGVPPATSPCSMKGFVGTKVWHFNLPMCGAGAAGCGLLGTALHVMELKSFADSLRSQNSNVPEGADFCEGVDGVEPDGTAEEGGSIL